MKIVILNSKSVIEKNAGSVEKLGIKVRENEMREIREMFQLICQTIKVLNPF